MALKIYHCKRCGQDWASKQEPEPKRCGKCKSPYWDRIRRKDIAFEKATQITVSKLDA